MGRLKNRIVSLENYISIREYLPMDRSDRWSLNRYLERFYAGFSGPVAVLDLGCGEGNSIDLFQKLSGDTNWHGVDIENSPEASKGQKRDESAVSFDGVNLPYSDDCFDLIYCNQVLEHVRYPDALITDALRVLKPGGWFIGSVAYLEPYHSYSIFNFTPYGIVRVFGDAGFELGEIRPGVDASFLINRQLLNRSGLLRPVWKCNFLHGIIGFVAAMSGLEHRERNFLKIQFSGQLVFLAKRPL